MAFRRELTGPTQRYGRGPFARLVFTDEYQDLNRAEQVLIDLLAESGTHTIVGDEVIDMANSLIEHNRDRADRQLHPADGQPVGEVHIVQWPSLQDEAEGLAKFIKARINGGKVDAGKVLVLCPVRPIGYLIRDALVDAGVPAHSFFQEEILEGNAAKPDECQTQQAFTLLNLLADKRDRVALRCWCGFGTGTRRSGPWSNLRAHCEKTGSTPWDALEEIDAGSLVVPGTNNLLVPFRDARRLLDLYGEVSGDELVNAVFPEDEAWSTGIRSLIASFKKNWTGATQLRDQLRVAITQPELPTDVEYVRVMSLHKSKGLTADMVVVADLIEGVVPRVDTGLPEVDQDSQLREQRRLFYVAMTRTRQVLILSSVARLRKEVAFKIGARPGAVTAYSVNTIASRFLDELGPSAPRPRRGKELIG